MKAILCKAFGPPDTLVLEDVPSLAPKDHEVVVAVKAAAVNFPDTLMIEGKYQFQPPFPFSPGGELAGIVKQCGAKVTALKPGDRVMASSGVGAFAEEAAVDAARCLLMPEGLDFATASGFVMTYGTSHYALKDRARLQKGESLLVLGAAGGVGLAAVELGKLMGARVIAAASSEGKLAVARAHGADEGLLYSAEPLDRGAQKAFSDAIKAKTDGQGVDVVYDPVGASYAEPAVRALAWEGRFLVIGFAGGEIPKLPLNLPLLKSCQIVGVFWGAFTMRNPERNTAHLKELVGWIKEGKLKPHICQTFPLAETPQALAYMAARKAQGKIIISME